MPCWAMMPPIRKVISRMIGTACQPTRSRWCTTEVMRRVCGCRTTPTRAWAMAAQHLHEHDEVAADPRRSAPDALERQQHPVLGRRHGARRAVGAVHLLEQAQIAVGQGQNLDRTTALRPGSRQSLQQPGAIGVERLHGSHVDGGGARLRGLRDGRLDQRLEGLGMAGRPGARRGELETPMAQGAHQLRSWAQSVLHDNVGVTWRAA